MSEERSAPLGGARSALGSVDSLLACLRQELYEMDCEFHKDIETMERADYMALGIIRAMDFHLERCQAKQQGSKRKK